MDGRNALTVCAPSADAADCWDLLVEFMSGVNGDGSNAIAINNNNTIDMGVSPYTMQQQQWRTERTAKRVSQRMFHLKSYCFFNWYFSCRASCNTWQNIVGWRACIWIGIANECQWYEWWLFLVSSWLIYAFILCQHIYFFLSPVCVIFTCLFHFLTHNF